MEAETRPLMAQVIACLLFGCQGIIRTSTGLLWIWHTIVSEIWLKQRQFTWWLVKASPLRWRHNGHNSVSNHQPHEYLLNVYSHADQRKHQSSASLAFVQGIHRGPVNSPHKWPVTQKMLPFDDVIMPYSGRQGQGGDEWYPGRHTFNYRKISNIRRIKSLNLNVSRLVLQLSLSNLLKLCVKLRIKM